MDYFRTILGEFFGFFIDLMVNALIFLYGILGDNFGLSIIGFTIIIRVLVYPLTRKQLHASKAMSSLQPRIREIQKKYANDRARVSQETMRLYKEQGVNPVGCLGPMVIQLPILIGLYRAILQAMPTSPEGFVNLSQRLWPWVPGVHSAVPLNERFIGLDLASTPGVSPVGVVAALLVGGSMWVQQRMTSTPPTDPKQTSMNRMMLWMMPVMFGVFTFGFPIGLSLYWVVSTLVGIAMQYRASGWGNLFAVPAPAAAKATGEQKAPAETSKEMVIHGEPGSDGEDGGGGDRPGPKAARRGSRRGRRRRRHRG